MTQAREVIIYMVLPGTLDWWKQWNAVDSPDLTYSNAVRRRQHVASR